MSALEREADLPLPFDADTRQRARSLFLKCFDYVFSSGVFCLTIDSAKATAHANLFFYVDPLHLELLYYIWYTASGCRIPYYHVALCMSSPCTLNISKRRGDI
jgi:hypothetical protein